MRKKGRTAHARGAGLGGSDKEKEWEPDGIWNLDLEGRKRTDTKRRRRGFLLFETRECRDLLKLGCWKRQTEHQKFDLKLGDLGVLQLVLQSGWVRCGPAKKPLDGRRFGVLKVNKSG